MPAIYINDPTAEKRFSNLITKYGGCKIYIEDRKDLKTSFFERPVAKKMLRETIDRWIIVESIKIFGNNLQGILKTILALWDQGYKIESISPDEEWIHKIHYPALKWIYNYQVDRLRRLQKKAWEKGKRKGRPPKLPDDIIIKYIRRYPTLARKNKKALWMILYDDGYKVRYETFLLKINRIIRGGSGGGHDILRHKS